MIVPVRGLFRGGLYRSLARRRRPGHRLSASPEPGTRKVAPQCLHPMQARSSLSPSHYPTAPPDGQRRPNSFNQTSP